MLVKTLDENLKRMGFAREIVNSVQRLRKQAGLNIDDVVEIFYELRGANPEQEHSFAKVLEEHIGTIRKTVKIPF